MQGPESKESWSFIPSTDSLLLNFQALAALRSIFREMGDPDGVRAFIAHTIDPSRASDAPLDVDALMYQLISEWGKRRDANLRDLGALLDGGDKNDDGALDLEEFLEVMKFGYSVTRGKYEVILKRTCMKVDMHIKSRGPNNAPRKLGPQLPTFESAAGCQLQEVSISARKHFIVILLIQISFLFHRSEL